jgi:phage terminase small subunit
MPRRRPRAGASDAGPAEGLTDAQDRFCQEYLVDLNATRAYLTAYPKVKRTTASANGSRLLANAKVAARVQQLQLARCARLGITADDVVRELAAVGMSDVEDLAFAQDGRLMVRPGGNPLARRAVASVKFSRVKGKRGELQLENAEIRLWSKPEALRMLALHTGVLKEQVDVTHRFVAEVPPTAESAAAWQQQHAPKK